MASPPYSEAKRAPTCDGPDNQTAADDISFVYFSELLKRPVCAGPIRDRIGKVTDLVVNHAEPFPQAAGICVGPGWGRQTEFILWDRVVKVDDDAIFVQPAADGRYPAFADQPGWMLVDTHLMGRTILDIDGRRVEVVN